MWFENNIIDTLSYFHFGSVGFSITSSSVFQNPFWHLIITFKHSWKYLLTIFWILWNWNQQPNSSYDVPKYKNIANISSGDTFRVPTKCLSHKESYIKFWMFLYPFLILTNIWYHFEKANHTQNSSFVCIL